MRSSSVIICVAILVAVMVHASMANYRGRVRKPNPRSCREANMCCSGQNNTCFVFGRRVDRSESSKRCYCDSNCIIMGDCCMDYHHHCKSIDCEVTEWQEWTACDNACGYGTRRRIRAVQIHPDNGGVICPVLKQRRACLDYKEHVCAQNRVEEQAEEKAERGRILPREFGIYRTMKKYDPWRGILKNLYSKYFNHIFSRPTYRAQFRITSTRRGCEKSDWANVLHVNTTVCVECQPVAMNREIGMRCRGHGVRHANTAWKAVDAPHCHGTWEMITPHEADTCKYDVEDGHKRNFIFL